MTQNWQITLTVNQIPVPDHAFGASTAIASGINPAGNVIGQSYSVNVLRAQAGNVALAPASISSVGGGQPHTNVQPYLCVSFIISLFGIFPCQT